jgi:hypothetical protein
MQKIFSHENRLIVFHMRNLLQDAGIVAHLRNEFASGGVGDLSPFETWPELWVDDGEAEQASALISSDFLLESDCGEWLCSRCGERNDGHFQLCWNCTQARMEPV